MPAPIKPYEISLALFNYLDQDRLRQPPPTTFTEAQLRDQGKQFFKPLWNNIVPPRNDGSRRLSHYLSDSPLILMSDAEARRLRTNKAGGNKSDHEAYYIDLYVEKKMNQQMFWLDEGARQAAWTLLSVRLPVQQRALPPLVDSAPTASTSRSQLPPVRAPSPDWLDWSDASDDEEHKKSTEFLLAGEPELDDAEVGEKALLKNEEKEWAGLLKKESELEQEAAEQEEEILNVSDIEKIWGTGHAAQFKLAFLQFPYHPIPRSRAEALLVLEDLSIYVIEWYGTGVDDEKTRREFRVMWEQVTRMLEDDQVKALALMPRSRDEIAFAKFFELFDHNDHLLKSTDTPLTYIKSLFLSSEDINLLQSSRDRNTRSTADNWVEKINDAPDEDFEAFLRRHSYPETTYEGTGGEAVHAGTAERLNRRQAGERSELGQASRNSRPIMAAAAVAGTVPEYIIFADNTDGGHRTDELERLIFKDRAETGAVVVTVGATATNVAATSQKEIERPPPNDLLFPPRIVDQLKALERSFDTSLLINSVFFVSFARKGVTHDANDPFNVTKVAKGINYLNALERVLGRNFKLHSSMESVERSRNGRTTPAFDVIFTDLHDEGLRRGEAYEFPVEECEGHLRETLLPSHGTPPVVLVGLSTCLATSAVVAALVGRTGDEGAVALEMASSSFVGVIEHENEFRHTLLVIVGDLLYTSIPRHIQQPKLNHASMISGIGAMVGIGCSIEQLVEQNPNLDHLRLAICKELRSKSMDDSSLLSYSIQAYAYLLIRGAPSRQGSPASVYDVNLMLQKANLMPESDCSETLRVLAVTGVEGSSSENILQAAHQQALAGNPQNRFMVPGLLKPFQLRVRYSKHHGVDIAVSNSLGVVNVVDQVIVARFLGTESVRRTLKATKTRTISFKMYSDDPTSVFYKDPNAKERTGVKSIWVMLALHPMDKTVQLRSALNSDHWLVDRDGCRLPIVGTSDAIGLLSPNALVGRNVLPLTPMLSWQSDAIARVAEAGPDAILAKANETGVSYEQANTWAAKIRKVLARKRAVEQDPSLLLSIDELLQSTIAAETAAESFEERFEASEDLRLSEMKEYEVLLKLVEEMEGMVVEDE